jgi:hypothetical protein
VDTFGAVFRLVNHKTIFVLSFLSHHPDKLYFNPNLFNLLTMYKLFIGFKKMGEFSSILEAKQFTDKSGMTGMFTLLGDNYYDNWYVPKV